MAAIYAVYTSPNHPPMANHLPTLIVTPHGQPQNILYSYVHTNFNAENYLLTPSPQGDLCVAKMFPPRNGTPGGGKSSASDPGHGSGGARVVRCEASRNLKWTITNTGVISPIYKLSLPSPDSPDLPLFQISKPNPNAAFWSMFYFAYAGHNIPPKRIEFGKIQKNPSGTNGGGTRISITGKSPEEKNVWQTLGEGNEDCVEWVVLCAALNLLDDEIMKAAEKNPAPVQLRDGPAPVPAPAPGGPGGPGGPQRPGPSATPQPGSGPARGPPPPNMGPGGPGAMPPRGPGGPVGPPGSGRGGPMPPAPGGPGGPPPGGFQRAPGSYGPPGPGMPGMPQGPGGPPPPGAYQHGPGGPPPPGGYPMAPQGYGRGGPPGPPGPGGMVPMPMGPGQRPPPGPMGPGGVPPPQQPMQQGGQRMPPNMPPGGRF